MQAEILGEEMEACHRAGMTDVKKVGPRESAVHLA
jgi:hypothetical protein